MPGLLDFSDQPSPQLGAQDTRSIFAIPIGELFGRYRQNPGGMLDRLKRYPPGVVPPGLGLLDAPISQVYDRMRRDDAGNVDSRGIGRIPIRELLQRGSRPPYYGDGSGM